MADTQSKIAKFLSAEKSIVSKPVNPFSGQKTVSEATPGTNVSTDEQRSKLPSFWIPSLTPDSKPTEIKKPVSTYNVHLYSHCFHHCMRDKVVVSPRVKNQLPTQLHLCTILAISSHIMYTQLIPPPPPHIHTHTQLFQRLHGLCFYPG